MIKIVSPSQLSGTLKAPPSKSFTHRALLCAALSHGNSHILNPLISDDTLVTVKALKTLGVKIQQSESELHIAGMGGVFHPIDDPADLDFQNSGTSLRLLLPMCLLSRKTSFLHGSERLSQRPIKSLVTVLRKLGGKIDTTNFHLPFTVHPSILSGGEIQLDASESSQFVSALLLLAPYMQNDFTLSVENLVSSPYVGITNSVMNTFGVQVEKLHSGYYVVAGQKYKSCSYHIEGDYSSASYFIVGAAISQSPLTIKNLPPQSVQGDFQILKILKSMGCICQIEANAIKIIPHTLTGIAVDMSTCPDLVPSVAILGAYAQGITHITNIGHLRGKESDRINSLKSELEKIGISVSSSEDSLTIQGGEPHGAIIDVHDDHRIAMSLAIAGLQSKTPMTITNAQVVQKSYPKFWDDLKSVKGRVQTIN